MSARLTLVLLTLVAVLSDSLLHPFYPQYFAEVLGVHSAQQVGLYIATCSLTVLVAFPLWARFAARRAVFKLLVVTQLAAAVCSLGCAAATSPAPFWVLSLTMLAFKASYLLIYPLVLSLEGERHHLGTISLLAFVVHAGSTLGALVAGAVMQWWPARWLFVLMAGGDVLQTGLCLALLWGRASGVPPDQNDANLPARPAVSRSFILRLAAVMLVLCFGGYLTEPFFAAYWESLRLNDDHWLSGFVFAIPGFAALAALVSKRRAPDPRGPGRRPIAIAMAVAAVGLVLQCAHEIALLLVGRALFGWALFQATVRLDLVLFRASTPSRYALDFSQINFAQGLGVLLSSCASGALFEGGARRPFLVASVALLASLALFMGLFSGLASARPALTVTPSSSSITTPEGAT